jgi:hypothetical protein
MASKLAIIRAKLNAFKSAIADQGGASESRLTVYSVQQFNFILEDLTASFPEVARDLPNPFHEESKFNMIGQTDVSQFDLEVAVRTILGIIEVIEADQK